VKLHAPLISTNKQKQGLNIYYLDYVSDEKRIFELHM